MEHVKTRLFQREQNPYKIVPQAIYLYLSGLSIRQTAESYEKKAYK